MPYYVSIGGQNYGPAEPDELQKWHKAGSFNPTDFVWNEDANEWTEAARFAPLAHHFDTAAAPAVGIEEIDELPREQSALQPAAGPETESWCANHETNRATAVCPHCRKSFCAQCMVSTGGISVCIDCVSSEKGSATKSPKRTVLLIGAVIVLIGIAVGSYLFFAPKPIEQPATPELIELKRGDAPASLAAPDKAAPPAETPDTSDSSAGAVAPSDTSTP
ncbi:MAG: GYF domain-containing protein [Candidatus Hydrogenedentota bacterium]